MNQKHHPSKFRDNGFLDESLQRTCTVLWIVRGFENEICRCIVQTDLDVPKLGNAVFNPCQVLFADFAQARGLQR